MVTALTPWSNTNFAHAVALTTIQPGFERLRSQFYENKKEERIKETSAYPSLYLNDDNNGTGGCKNTSGKIEYFKAGESNNNHLPSCESYK